MSAIMQEVPPLHVPAFTIGKGGKSAAPARDPLRIVHAVISLEVGGLERLVVDLVREGVRLQNQVTVLCVERSGVLADAVMEAGGKVVCVSKGPGIKPRVVREIRSILQDLRPHVLHSHQAGALVYGGPAARKARVPVVVHTEHGKHYAHSLKARLLGRFGARYTQRFFCVSNDVAKEVRACKVASPGKIDVVFNGIRTDHFRPRAPSAELRARYGIPADALVLGTVGRLAEVKRQDILIHGFAKIRRQLPNLHMLLVGDGVMRQPLVDLAAELNVSPFVHFAGYQSDTASHLCLMNAFALTSRSEGMPLGILEAWAAGVPVVASRVGGVPELIKEGQNGLLFEAGDVQAFAAAAGRLFVDQLLRNQLRANAMEDVRRDFDLRNMADRYDAEYRRLLSNVCLG